jgi:hypothetical protein
MIRRERTLSMASSENLSLRNGGSGSLLTSEDEDDDETLGALTGARPKVKIPGLMIPESVKKESEAKARLSVLASLFRNNQQRPHDETEASDLLETYQHLKKTKEGEMILSVLSNPIEEQTGSEWEE